MADPVKIRMGWVLQRVFGIEKDAGLLKRDLIAADYADLSYIKEAGARLK